MFVTFLELTICRQKLNSKRFNNPLDKNHYKKICQRLIRPAFQTAIRQ
ncbi:hypothetical protein Q7O_003172 [Pectobacterium carotovorum subsp. carotovorum PCCS1]|nr:hypothetical protein [Pectobacterium carotovorum subsp. carotovorum PCCS1]